MKYLLSVTDVYRVPKVEDVEALNEELSKDVNFTLSAFSYKTKYVKLKGEIIDEYQVVTAKKVFNDEKEPVNSINVRYEV